MAGFWKRKYRKLHKIGVTVKNIFTNTYMWACFKKDICFGMVLQRLNKEK